MKNFLSIITISMIAILILPNTTRAQSFNDEQKAELEKMFNQYIMNNGEVILDSVNKYQKKQLADSQKEQSEKAVGFISEIKKNKSLPMAGNKDGDVTIVEFFDYNCGYCHKALSEVKDLLETEKDAKIVFIDMPILGPQSTEAAKWAIAANMQAPEKYFELHKAIMDHKGPKDPENLEKIAKNIGFDITKLKKDKDSDEVNSIISANIEKARNLGIQGTPGFIIEDQIVRGFIPASQMEQMIADARKK